MKQIKAHRLNVGDTIQLDGVSGRVRAIERLVDRGRVWYSITTTAGREKLIQAQRQIILLARSS